MLVLDGESFTSGRSKFFDQHPKFVETTAKIFVKVTLIGYDEPVMAQLDTGAAYSILETEVAERMGLFNWEGHPTRLGTRLGTINGQIIRLPLTLVADDGISLDLNSPFFVSREWRGVTFLGYIGLIDRLRIALDSPANLFYFGEED